MATVDTPPPDYPPEITGYAEPWIASPGETVAIKVSDISMALNLVAVLQMSNRPCQPDDVLFWKEGLTVG